MLLPQRSTPELAYLQARFAAVTSYGLSATLLGELLPPGSPLHATAVRRQAHAVAQRLEDEPGAEQSSFIEGCPRDWSALGRPSCHWSSDWMAATCTPVSNPPAGTAGSR